jgi:hypothetical protein
MIGQTKSELDAEIKKGAVHPVKPIDLILMVISLNATLFIAHPIPKTLANMSDGVFENCLLGRKKKTLN